MINSLDYKPSKSIFYRCLYLKYYYFFHIFSRKLFHLKGGLTGFLVFHFPVLFLFLYGLILVYQQTIEGYIISLLLNFAGLFAFSIHTYFIKVKNREEFTLPISKAILISTLILSLVQAAITIYLLIL